MRRRQQNMVPGLGQQSAQEFAFQPGTEVTVDADVHPLTGVVTDVRQDEAGQQIIYVLPFGGRAQPYLARDLTPTTRRTSILDRFDPVTRRPT